MARRKRIPLSFIATDTVGPRKIFQATATFKLDMDTKLKPNELIQQLRDDYRAIVTDFRYHPKLLPAKFKVYKTTHGYHVYIYTFVNDFDDYDTVIIQLAMGSDRQREIHNLKRISIGIEHWNVLFMEKYRVGWNKTKRTITKVSNEKYLTTFIVK